MTQPTTRVVSVPAGHPYPRAIHDGPAPRVTVLPDPDPRHPDRPVTDGVWWPHPGLDPAWLATQRFDLLHVHFGFEHRTPAQLAELVDFLRATGRPLVVTVHDLRSPHQADSAPLDAQLDVLVPAADALVTLTSWAAGEIARRWGREAVVSPHPPLVPLVERARLRRQRLAARRHVSGPASRPVVAVSAKSLRANCDPLRLLPTLHEVTRDQGARLRLLVHADALVDRPAGTGSTARPEQARRLARALEEEHWQGAQVVVHQPMSDADLWAELADQDVAVLPYRFGTHSGWLEACHDLGTLVAAPAFGGYAAQGADAVYDATESELDEASLATAVETLVQRARTGRLAGEEATARERARLDAVALHAELYARLTRAAGVPA